MLLFHIKSLNREERVLDTRIIMKQPIRIIEPQTPKEFEAYFFLRYEVLRKPWNQPLGSEKDENENTSIHLMAIDENNSVLGVCRLQFNSHTEAQLRFMAVKKDLQGLGIGRRLIEYAELKAQNEGASSMILQARENAIDFYKKCNYSLKEKSFLMWNQIQHYLMIKEFK